MARRLILGIVLLACVSSATAVVSTPRLREKAWQPLAKANELEGKYEPERVAGYFALDRTYAAEMFYFYFEARHNQSDAPLLIWLTGGPGCSSELAVFKENGPYELNSKGEVVERELAWDVTSNVIFVDSPVNVGFSYSDDPRDRVFDEATVADDLLDFMQQFLKARPHLADRDFFVTGESYAGHYIPAVAHHMWAANKDATTGQRINLKGVAIGNGLTAPEVQYGSYSVYGVKKDLITESEADSIATLWPVCRFGIHVCNMGIPLFSPLLCQASLYFCQVTQFSSVLALAMPEHGSVNVYDVRKQCVGPLCYDFSDVEAYMNRPETLKELGVPEGRTWQMCDMSVNADFHADFMLNYQQKLVPLLQDGIRVMIYVGMEDLICNEIGNKWWVQDLEWQGAAEWNAAPEETWRVAGEAAGSSQVAEPLSFVKVSNAGHMVPMDQAKNALDMITRFTRGEDFGARDSAKLASLTGAQIQGSVASS